MTFRSPIFRKFLAATVLLIGLAVAALDFYLTRYTSRHEVAHVQLRLASAARILAGEIPSVPPSRLEGWAKSAGARAGTRVTIISPAGVVLADSQHDPETMENHSGRPEIREARAHGMGASIRHSHTLDRDLCYVAISLTGAREQGTVLRLAVPLESVKATVRAVEARILLASLGAALLALAVAYSFSRSLTRRIDRLRAFAERLGAQPSQLPGETLDPGPRDELGLLAASLNRTAGQLREMVERLSLESARREVILASMVEGVLAVSHDLRVTFSNQAFMRALGRSGPVEENLPLVECIRDLELHDLLERVVSTGAPEKKRLQIASAEGRAFEVQATPLAAPSRSPNGAESRPQPSGALAILHDITDLERLERVRSDFVANVSHELRTPLTAIRGYTETLLEGGLEDAENNRKFLEIIKAHSIRLNNIASDLLTLSELESGKAAAELQAVSVRAAVETALRTVEPEAGLREVRLVQGPFEDAFVRGDRTRLEQALINLLSNAVKFNRTGGEARISAERAGDQIRIVVADSGIGIPSSDLPRIFERFYRVDKARSRELGGTGLGLSIVKHVIERMGGSVSVSSLLGKGSTFTVLLPIDASPPSRG